MNTLMSALQSSVERIAPELLEIYRDLHRHPELSRQEHRTAGIAADYLEKLGYAVTRGVGVTGVVGLLQNGDGPKGDAPRRHGRASDGRGHRVAICQHRDRHR